MPLNDHTPERPEKLIVDCPVSLKKTEERFLKYVLLAEAKHDQKPSVTPIAVSVMCVSGDSSRPAGWKRLMRTAL